MNRYFSPTVRPDHGFRNSCPSTKENNWDFLHFYCRGDTRLLLLSLVVPLLALRYLISISPLTVLSALIDPLWVGLQLSIGHPLDHSVSHLHCPLFALSQGIHQLKIISKIVNECSGWLSSLNESICEKNQVNCKVIKSDLVIKSLLFFSFLCFCPSTQPGESKWIIYLFIDHTLLYICTKTAASIKWTLSSTTV